MSLKDFKQIGGHRFMRVSDSGMKGYATGIAKEFRSGRRTYNGRKVKAIRVVKTANGYAVYMR